MAKLHFWINPTGKHPTEEATGDGEVPKKSGDFTVEITSGTVKQGVTYDVRQGTSAYGDKCNCQAGASKGGTAKFHKQQ